MPVNFEIIPAIIGSQLVETIQSDEPNDLNDFDIFIVGDDNATLAQSNVTVSSGSTIVAFEGENSTYKATIRPPQTAGIVTVSIGDNVIPEGNASVSKNIRVSTSFPDVDAEVPTQLFSVNLSNVLGIAVSPTRLLISNQSPNQVHSFTYTGTEQVSESFTPPIGIDVGYLDYINNTLLNTRSDAESRYDLNGTLLETYIFSGVGALVHTRLGVLKFGIGTDPFRYLAYGKTAAADVEDLNVLDFTSLSTTIRFLGAHQNDLLFLVDGKSSGGRFGLAQITDTPEIELLRVLNIEEGTGYFNQIRDIAIYRDTLYILQDNGSTGAVYTLDIRKYRPLSQNTKNTIYPVFIGEGETLNLEQFAPDAERIIWDVGFDKPDFLSINANNQLSVSSNAVTETSPILVKLRGINRIDSIAFQFYLILEPAVAPTWRDLDNLAMRANSKFNLFQIVPDADTITVKSGFTNPIGSSLSNDGVFRIGTTGGEVQFTATKGTLTSDIDFNVDVVQPPDLNNLSDVYRYTVEISGIDVTEDLLKDPPVRLSKSIDAVVLNQYRADSITIALRNSDEKYTPANPANFWTTNSLNLGGYQESVNIFVESYVNNAWVSTLAFSGIIETQAEVYADVRVNITAHDITVKLERFTINDFGTLSKWAAFQQQSDEVDGTTDAGVYVPEGSLAPIQPRTGKAWQDRSEMTVRKLQLPTKGPPLTNTGYLTATEFQTSGGYLDNLPLLNFKVEPRHMDIRSLINQLALTSDVYATDIQLPDFTLDSPTTFNLGSVPYAVEDTRITRLPVDWVYDSTNTRVLMLLSNPEGHISDLLVEWKTESGAYRVLHTFSKDVKVHRIERRDATNYYILTSAAISQDRSAPTLPRPSDKTGYGSDAVAEGSVIRIYHYNASTDTLTEHVPEDNARPPQLGIHYWVGFENDLYIDEFEGIVPYDRGAFKWYSGNLYYRYATDAEFGVARVDAAGTTSEMIDQARGGYWDHLNFAFDVNTETNGDLYFVYAIVGETDSSLVIKRRTSNGTESTILTDTKSIGLYSEALPNFGVYLGAHECLFHNNYLYILAPSLSLSSIGNATADITPTTTVTSEDTGLTGEAYVTTSGFTQATSSVSPGEAIPVRINFNKQISGLTQSELDVLGGEITSFSINVNNVNITIKPDSPFVHRNIVIKIPRNAVNEGNEATEILLDFGLELGKQNSAGMTLYRCDVTAANPALTLIDTWDFVTRAGCNLCVNDGNVHYIENSPAAAMFKPINSDMSTFNSDSGYNILPASLDALKKVDTSGDVESLGKLWSDGGRSFNIAATRALSFEDELHVMMGYGNLDEVLRLNSLASSADNVVHIVFGNKLRYILPEFSINDNIYAKLATLARQVGATLTVNNNIISVIDRQAFRAKTDGATGTGTADIAFDGANKAFPDSGNLRIGDEFLTYTGISGGAFTGVSRGALGTEVINHADDTDILYVDTLLSESDISKIKDVQTDTTRHYNVIADDDIHFDVRDDASVAQYGEKPYSLDLGLTSNEDAWIEHIFNMYLEELKDVASLWKLSLSPRKETRELEAKQLVGFLQAGRVHVLRVASVTKSRAVVDVTARSVS